jgi:hypothetical protein
MGCELRDELGIQYLEALDLVRKAEQRLNQAVTVTNTECARTEVRRVEEHRLDLLREIVEHCNGHDCCTPEMEEICRRAIGRQKLAVAS